MARTLLRWRQVLYCHDLLKSLANSNGFDREVANQLAGLESMLIEYVDAPSVGVLERWLRSYGVQDHYMAPDVSKTFLGLWLQRNRDTASLLASAADHFELMQLATCLRVSEEAVVNVLDDQAFRTTVSEIDPLLRDASTAMANAFLDCLGFPSKRNRIRKRKMAIARLRARPTKVPMHIVSKRVK